MKKLQQWLSGLLSPFSQGKKLDVIDEASDESFPASDPPAWAGSENKAADLLKLKDPLAVLKEEHRALMKAAYLLHEQIERLEQNKGAQVQVLTKLIAFFKQFIEDAHYQKESQLLLPALKRCGAPLGDCSLTLLEQDHERSQALLNTLENLLPACEKNESLIRQKLMETLTELKELYTRHTLKEENFVFPLAEKYLSAGVQKTLFEAFADIDRRS